MFGLGSPTRLLAASIFAILAWQTPGSAFAEGGATLLAAKGDVRVRGAKEKSYHAIAAGAAIADGSRLKTGEDGEAKVKFPDGTETDVRAKSEIIVRAPGGSAQPSSTVVFFGRVWSSVAKASGGQNSFEVRSANAVAGVRGTKFEVGVADDGSTRVVVTEGTVAVGGDGEEEPVAVEHGQEVESDGEGKLAGKRQAAKDPDWAGWFQKRARELEKTGLKVAKSLDGRLNQRKAKLDKLLKEQRGLREQIDRLAAEQKRGGEVGEELKVKLASLEKVTARIEDMKQRLEGAFGLFERWGGLAKKGAMQGGEEVGRMADDIARIAADFADMIEEGTDQSEEGMDDMMKDMKDVKGAKKQQRPKQNAGDELFR